MLQKKKKTLKIPPKIYPNKKKIQKQILIFYIPQIISIVVTPTPNSKGPGFDSWRGEEVIPLSAIQILAAVEIPRKTVGPHSFLDTS